MRHLPPRRLFGVLFAFVILSSTPGCAFLQQLFSNIKWPQVKVTSVKPELKDIGNAVLIFNLRIDNPNPVGLQLDGVRYTLGIEGRTVAEGTTRKKLRLKPSGASATAIAVQVKLVNVANSLVELLSKRSVAYQGKLALGIATPVGEIEVPVAHSGNLPLPQTPPLVLESLQVTRIDLSGLTLTANVKVHNPNPFKMPVDALKLSLNLNNRQVAGVSAPPGLTMQPGQPLRVPLNITVSPVAIGLSAAQLLQHPSLNYAASMELATGPLKLPAQASGQLRL